MFTDRPNLDVGRLFNCLSQPGPSAYLWIKVIQGKRILLSLSCTFLFRFLVVEKYTPCLKNDTDAAHSNFDADQPISIIFGKDVAERICYQTVICYPTSFN